MTCPKCEIPMTANRIVLQKGSELVWWVRYLCEKCGYAEYPGCTKTIDPEPLRKGGFIEFRVERHRGRQSSLYWMVDPKYTREDPEHLIAFRGE